MRVLKLAFDAFNLQVPHSKSFYKSIKCGAHQLVLFCPFVQSQRNSSSRPISALLHFPKANAKLRTGTKIFGVTTTNLTSFPTDKNLLATSDLMNQSACPPPPSQTKLLKKAFKRTVGNYECGSFILL